MKRRTFIHAMGAAGALGLSGRWTLAEAVDRAASVQPLTPVFDRLPSLLAAAAMKASPRATCWKTGTRTFTPW
jgi:hypothetical protein